MRAEKPEQQSLFGTESHEKESSHLALKINDTIEVVISDKKSKLPVSDIFNSGKYVNPKVKTEIFSDSSNNISLTDPDLIILGEEKISQIESRYITSREVKKSELPPMLRQYVEIKEKYPGYVLLFQVGDFFEVFFEDAVTVSDVLSIRLTSRDKDQDSPIPMCGVPIHAFENYLPKLVANGFSCVVVEQIEDLSEAKGLVRRDVTRVITPGVRFDGEGLNENSFNYLGAVITDGIDGAIVGFIDISTGILIVREANSINDVENLLNRYSPTEILIPFQDEHVKYSNKEILATCELHANRQGIKISYRSFNSLPDPDCNILDHFSVEESAYLELKKCLSVSSKNVFVLLHGLLQYVQEVSLKNLLCISSFSFARANFDTVVDAATIRNLELTEASFDGDRKYSVLGVLDKTKTAAGGRLLRDWILSPLADQVAINDRLDALEEVISRPESIELVRRFLSEIRDIERLASRISGNRASPHDFSVLRSSLKAVPAINEALWSFNSKILQAWVENFDTMPDILDLLCRGFVDDPPHRLGERDVVRSEYNEELARLRSIRADSSSLLNTLEQQEREKTGIHNLRVKHNSVFGYFIEISKGQSAKVPSRYIPRQTLANSVRFVTPELKTLEKEIFSSQARIFDLERTLFMDIRAEVARSGIRLQCLARKLAFLDVVFSFAYISIRNSYVRPVITSELSSKIKGGRHPVVEQVVGRQQFIPNDLYFDANSKRYAVLTGPNMGGKSTYLRQVGIIHVLAQAGCFVPAEEAVIGVADRIFTRIGSGDALARGESTFMVEMKEAANILKRATERSLVLIDEIGRGTATADGLALATAISHYLIDTSKCRTIFATHFHELTTLPDYSNAVFCLSVGILETRNSIEFTHRIENRASEKSYGIHVAQLAGIPEEVLRKSESLIASGNVPCFGGSLINESCSVMRSESSVKVSDVLPEELKSVFHVLRSIDPMDITPLGALELLFELSRKVREGKDTI
ncbi:MAG TPA: DNA mismatch repair protein MutS [Oligoflexia bacterium]|nr:DNA mismatch repair protein MutS [Oligoflexia bacterium]HMP47154.1 DNA mismatch repair protein MutS [Oligoflexia bacterium]